MWGSDLTSSLWGHVADLVTEGCQDVGLVHAAPFAAVGVGADMGGPGSNWGWRTCPTKQGKLHHILFVNKN